MNHPYIAISRKFRPQIFDQVIGQDSTVTSLRNAIKLNRISPAYLFSGTRGCGKTTLARLFAKALTCPKRTENFNPCNACDQCRAIDQSRSLDVVEIDGASHRGIDDIRQLRENAGYSAGFGNWRIYIIDEVHMLTKEAFNALLKTLEDPPSKVVFLLATTEFHRIPLTIQSRCQRYVLNLVNVDLIESKLRNILAQSAIEHESEALALIAAAAEGSMRDAESLLDQVLCLSNESLTANHVRSALGLIDGNWFFKLDECVQKKDIKQIFTLAKELLSGGIDLNNACLQLTKHYRNHLLMQIFNTGIICEMMQLPKSLIAAYAERMDIYNQELCLAILDVIKQHQMSFKTSAYSRIYLEMMLIEIVKSSDLISWSSMWKRLDLIQSMIMSAPLATPLATGQMPKQKPDDASSEQVENGDMDEVNSQDGLNKSSLADSLDRNCPKSNATPSQNEQSEMLQIEKITPSELKPTPNLSTARRETLLNFARVEFGGQIEAK